MPVAASAHPASPGASSSTPSAMRSGPTPPDDDEGETEPDPGRCVEAPLDGVEAVDRRAEGPEDAGGAEADAGERRSDVVGDVEHERQVAADAAERDDEERAQRDHRRYAVCHRERPGRQGGAHRRGEGETTHDEGDEAGEVVLAAVEGERAADAEQGDGGREPERRTERLTLACVRHFGAQGVILPDVAPQCRQEQEEGGDEEERRQQEDEPPADEGLRRTRGPGPEQAGQDPRGRERREDLGAQVLGQGPCGEDEGRDVDESLGDPGEPAPEEEDGHRRCRCGDDLGRGERPEPGEEDGARPGPVDPATRHDDGDHERHHRGRVGRAEPREPVEGPGRGGHDADDRAVLEGPEGDEGDDADGDRQVPGAEEALGGLAGRCGGGRGGRRGHAGHPDISSAPEIKP